METPSKSTQSKKHSPNSITGSSIFGKRKRSIQKENSWEEFLENLKKSNKDDFNIRYYFTSEPGGVAITQADRDFVAQAMEYYSTKSKRDRIVVAPPIQPDIQGVTNNRNANNPVRVVFKTVKHLQDMYSFLQQSRAAHNNLIVHISVDGSSYFEIL